ncbi:DUF2207 family protein [Mariniluteicoccus endophyticus]
MGKLRIGAVLMVMAVWFGITAPAAHAEGKVENHASTITIERDGALKVQTTITLGQAAPATLVQKIATREAAMDQTEYVFDVSDTKVAADGRAGEVKTDKDTITFSVPTSGAKEVVISYTVRGAAHPTPGDTSTVRWEVLQGLNAQADNVTADILVPGQFSDFKCVAGPPATEQSCASSEGTPHSGANPKFSDGPRGEGEVVGLRMAFPSTVLPPNQVVEELWTVGRAFSSAPLPLGLSLGLLALGGLGLWLLHRRAGRDAHPEGDPTPIARFERTDGVSVFKVGDSVLPGQIGTVADERVDPIDVTATIVDLAVRRHLRIAEMPRRSEFAPTDWTFEPGDGGDRAALRPFEEELLDALVPADGKQVRVSEIGPTISAHIPSVQDKLYTEMVDHGWYERRPDSTRNVWNQGAIIALILAIVLTGLLAAFTSFGLVGVAAIALALGLAFVAQEMPARTSKGARLLAGLGELRQQLMTHPTDEMPKGHEYRELSQVLPYAIVLGGSERWLEALVAADDDANVPDPTDLYWYHGPQNWHLRDLPDSLRNFITTVSGNLFAR